jgi:hypothetical protein
MKFMRRTTRFNYYTTEEILEILEELKVDPVEKKLAQHKQKLSHFSRVKDIRYPKHLTISYRKTKTWTTFKGTTKVKLKVKLSLCFN